MTQPLHAVLDEDLRPVLAALGLLDRVLAGEIRCASCGVTITLENLSALLPKASGTVVFCNASGCMPDLSDAGELGSASD